MKSNLIKFVEWFYLPFIKRYVPIETFRYGVCGGANMVFDMVLYFLIFNYVIDKQNIELGVITVSSQIAAFLITFPITFISGFWLTKHISFQNKSSKTKTQTLKYFSVVCVNILTKYFGLKLLVDVWAIFPSISNAIMTLVTILISYMLQKKYTFSHKNS